MEQLKDEVQKINAILAKLTPEGREAWLAKGLEMANTIEVMEAGGFRIVPAEG